MTTSAADIIERVKQTLSGKATEFRQPSPNRVYFAVSRDDAPALAGKLFAEMGGRLQTITCVETRAGMELMYHVAFGTANLSCTLRTLLPVPSPDVESLTPVIPAAEWIEREIHELFGVNFRNHPNLEHLILADDWPEGEYPLRRRAE